MVTEAAFVLEVTGADASAQNGITEISNKYTGNTI